MDKQKPAQVFHNRLRSARIAKGLSQGELAEKSGVTRQAISAVESQIYLPSTGVALQLASVLACRVEDLFSLAPADEIIEGNFIGVPPGETPSVPRRVKVATVRGKTIVRPMTELGEVLSYAVSADGYLIDTTSERSGIKARVRLSRERAAVDQDISVAGCDPAIFLAGEHLRRRKDHVAVVGWTMGSMAALRALQRGEVHVAGLHLFDPATGESNLPFLKRTLKGTAYDVVTFAIWEEGFLVRSGNPKGIREAADLADPSVTVINREEGSGARLLLDQRLRAAGIISSYIRGYDSIAPSHFEVARAIAGQQADAGIGIRSAAQLFGLDFVPIQAARYDLVVPTPYLKSHPTLAGLFDTLVSRPFRNSAFTLSGSTKAGIVNERWKLPYARSSRW